MLSKNKLSSNKILLYILGTLFCLDGSLALAGKNTSKVYTLFEKPTPKTKKKKKKKKTIKALFKEAKDYKKESCFNFTEPLKQLSNKKNDTKSSLSSKELWKNCAPYLPYISAFGLGYIAQKGNFTLAVIFFGLGSSYLEYTKQPKETYWRTLSGTAIAGLLSSYYCNRNAKTAIKMPKTTPQKTI